MRGRAAPPHPGIYRVPPGVYRLTNCLCIRHLFFWLIAATHESSRRQQKNKLGSGGTRTHASEETGALNQRLRPLGHATWYVRIVICDQFAFSWSDFNPRNKNTAQNLQQEALCNRLHIEVSLVITISIYNARFDWLK